MSVLEAEEVGNWFTSGLANVLDWRLQIQVLTEVYYVAEVLVIRLIIDEDVGYKRWPEAEGAVSCLFPGLPNLGDIDLMNWWVRIDVLSEVNSHPRVLFIRLIDGDDTISRGLEAVGLVPGLHLFQVLIKFVFAIYLSIVVLKQGNLQWITSDKYTSVTFEQVLKS